MEKIQKEQLNDYVREMIQADNDKNIKSLIKRIEDEIEQLRSDVLHVKQGTTVAVINDAIEQRQKRLDELNRMISSKPKRKESK
ncbi:hypothetical protein PP175_29075 (plasmid) [Aneurinibacillus sp. Ricciae_BoGa-3]|uniref:hypothetical protein n=1 Tax=Aneurinibacillus sp. Ricciae_BoGa-3 TaxID=3022697 RepID=UPI00233F82A1|nr:hypothetical protein [Aneurinibacillus sp. Ricciae_BoGa-3]WCK57245.1 hypothetical protein PP175_29075 [Aneurinibacillus sp. Ricciae_BoGa-3]